MATKTKTAKKSTAPKAASDKPADPPVAVVACPDDFMPVPRGVTAAQELAELLHSINAFEMAHNMTERVSYVASLDLEQFEALWMWAREVEWVLVGKPEGDSVTGLRASRMMAPEFFRAKLAKDLTSEDDMRALTKHIIEDAGEPHVDAPEASSAVVETTEAEPEPADADAAVSTEAPKAEADGQLQLVQEPTPPKKPLTPLNFQSGEQVASVRLALQARADDLKAEAKRLSGLGRTAEAAALEREAKDITEQLLRQVQSQTALAFNENETLPQAIKRVVQGEVRYRARTALLKSVAQRKGESKQDAEQRALGKLDDLEQLIGNIGEQAGLIMTRLIVEAADRGKEAGRVERTATASSIAREAIQAIESEQQREREAA